MKALIIIALALAIFGAAGYATYRLFIQPQQALKEEKLLPPPPPPPDPTVADYDKCVALRRTGKLIPAKDALYAFVEQYPQSTKANEAKDMLGEINTLVYLSPYPAPDKEVYIVKKGDVVDRVAKHSKTTSELLVRANGLKANGTKGIILQIGQKLTIPPLDLSVIINHKQDRVLVLNKGRFFKWYPVLAWPPALAKKPPAAGGKPPPPLMKQVGKVTDRMAWGSTGRVTYADPAYLQATHWIKTNVAHCTLHSVLDDKGENRPPGGGVVLSPKALEELAAMLSPGDPVTLE